MIKRVVESPQEILRRIDMYILKIEFGNAHLKGSKAICGRSSMTKHTLYKNTF